MPDNLLDSMKGEFVVGNRYRLINKIGTGSFSVVYVGKDVNTNEEVAVKLERHGSRYPQLFYEKSVYKVLAGGDRIPNIKYYGEESGYSVLVMDLLGPNLEDLFNFYSRKFTTKTILMLADQMISCIEYIHSRSFIHRDIAPTNFLMGIGNDSKKLFLVDFGIAKRYIKKGRHITPRTDKSLTGTPRYASVKNHLGRELSRRDDMESIGYVILYLINGRLPWQGLNAKDKKEKNERICEKKMSTSINDLCKGVPYQFARYLQYCRRRRYEDQPDYCYLRKIFKSLMDLQPVVADQLGETKFFWTDSSEDEKQKKRCTDPERILKELPTNSTSSQKEPSLSL